MFVAFIGQLEKWIMGTNGLPVNEIRETSLNELAAGLGALNDRKLLPSAYDMWEGSRSAGLLRLRYTYDVERLRGYSPATLQELSRDAVAPLVLGACTAPPHPVAPDARPVRHPAPSPSVHAPLRRPGSHPGNPPRSQTRSRPRGFEPTSQRPRRARAPRCGECSSGGCTTTTRA